jgi:hypothetical protein
LSRFPGAVVRSFYFACFIAVPFLKFLARNETGFFHPEIGMALLWLLLVSAALGAVSRKEWLFYVLAGACMVLAASYSFAALVHSWISLSLPASVIVVSGGTGLALCAMRMRFFPVMAVFLWSGLAVEMLSHVSWRTTPSAGSPGSGGHVLWLVLDEQIGLGGLPDTRACESARSTLENALRRHNFTVFPNAFSNYSDTIDSVPSIINSRLLRFPRELIQKTGTGNLRHYQVSRNLMFAGYARRGYQVVGYQHGSLRECDSSFSGADCRQYEDRLGWLYRAPGGWWERFRWLVGTYQAGDPLLGRVKGFFPARFGLKITGPLALTGLWPDRLASDIIAAKKRSLIFAHLLTPHSPYLFRSDGSIRPIEEWSGDRADERLDAAHYSERYRRYCEQVEFTARQLNSLLVTLDASGMLRGMTVVIHGDHGSRIRRSLGLPGDGQVMPGVFDYVKEPSLRDLQDRFSTLLAIKQPDAAAPAVNSERHGVLTFLAHVLANREPADGVAAADRVYLVNRAGQFQSIEILKYWR